MVGDRPVKPAKARPASRGDDSQRVDRYLPGNGDDSYSVLHYDLDLNYRPASNRLDGHAELDIVPARRLDRLALDLAGLTVAKVTVDGRRPKRYAHRGGKLLISLAAPVAAATPIRVAVTYSGQPKPIRGTWGDVGWEELSDGSLVAGQPNGAPSWFPCNDHPRDKARYRIAVTTSAPYVAVANGELSARHVHAGTTTWVYEQVEPMATYLATVQVGRYEIDELESANVRQRVVLPPRLRRLVAADFARQDRMMSTFMELFGPYPFAGYTVIVTDDALEIPLEAQGMSVFGANHIDGRRLHERLVAHELAHQWFGNSLTVARWQEIWLNEGFACYAEWLWSERAGGQSAHGHAERHWRRLEQLPQDLLLADPGPDLMFDDRLYKRGALTLHALRMSVGDEAFFQVLRQWVRNHRHGLVSTDGFVAHVDSALGASAREVIEPWLFRTPLPRLPAARTRPPT
jgi:aminopeptidase